MKHTIVSKPGFGQMPIILFLLTLLFIIPAQAQDSTPEAETSIDTYTNPVLDRDFPDPDVLVVDGAYYAYATNTDIDGQPINIQVARSEDLVTWEYVGEALPDLHPWARQEFGPQWAPEVTTTDDGYLMYFVTRLALGDGGIQCIGTAISAAPEGPFEPVGAEPFICQQDEGGSIDPSSFVDADGRRYVLWKNDGNSQGRPTWLYIQPVSEDGLTLEDEPVRLLTVDQPWEGNLIEAPTLWLHDDRYYLFYSANAYDSRNYGVGYAVSDDLLGPYEKPQREALLETRIPEGIVGPGGQDIVLDEDGNTWMLYHNWMGGGYRAMSLVALDWEDGVPVLNPTRAPMLRPGSD
ncbi:MAG: glycoside hydrolase family 43 protein [bacterium]|nr:glycoside hydrolase family 43 protein [bacterium]